MAKQVTGTDKTLAHGTMGALCTEAWRLYYMFYKTFAIYTSICYRNKHINMKPEITYQYDTHIKHIDMLPAISHQHDARTRHIDLIYSTNTTIRYSSINIIIYSPIWQITLTQHIELTVIFKWTVLNNIFTTNETIQTCVKTITQLPYLCSLKFQGLQMYPNHIIINHPHLLMFMGGTYKAHETRVRHRTSR